MRRKLIYCSSAPPPPPTPTHHPPPQQWGSADENAKSSVLWVNRHNLISSDTIFQFRPDSPSTLRCTRPWLFRWSLAFHSCFTNGKLNANAAGFPPLSRFILPHKSVFITLVNMGNQTGVFSVPPPFLPNLHFYGCVVERGSSWAVAASDFGKKTVRSLARHWSFANAKLGAIAPGFPSGLAPVGSQLAATSAKGKSEGGRRDGSHSLVAPPGQARRQRAASRGARMPLEQRQCQPQRSRS